MANEPRNTSTINQNSFVQAAKLYLLTSSNPLVAIVDLDKRNRIIKNYWKAITNLLVEDINDDTVIFKTIGVELFSLISSTIFNKLLVLKDFRVETIENILRLAMQQLPAEHLHIQDPTWWKSGGGASNINKAAARKIAYELNKCINSVESANSIVLL